MEAGMKKHLGSARENLVTIFDTINDYYFETDMQGIIVNINRAFYEHLGYQSREDVIGKNIRHFTDRKSIRDVFQNFSKLIETKRTVDLFRHSYFTRQGARVGETTVSPILEGETVIGARGVLRDITDRMLMEEDQLRTKDELKMVLSDLEIGHQIQSDFFPETIPEIPGWEIATYFEAARQVAGDFYDVFQLKNTNLTAIIIADVCDKGVGAALFMVLFRSLLRAFSEVEGMSTNIRAHLKNIILRTNNYVAKIHKNANMFATIFFGVLDPEKGTFYYVNAGHIPPAILNKEGEIVRRLMPTGPAIGLFPDVNCQVEQIEFNKGDFLVGFTDGATDVTNPGEQLFSEERLLKYIQAPWTSLFSMIYELKGELKNYMGGERQFDDITMISLRRKPGTELEKHAICRPAQINVLDELLHFVQAACEQIKLNDEDAFAFKLATEKICTRIIQHGFEGKQPGWISLFFENDPTTTRLIIRDDGKFFPPDLDEVKKGGLGIPSLQGRDSFSYIKMKENGNQFTFARKF
jgi:sigma-B regulation protein RsbU (phosphoserine phosphatase)